MSIVRDPAYRRLWVSGLCSNMARWMDLVAVGWIALQMTGSPFMVAVAAFARSAPMMVLGPFAGIVADRVSRAHLPSLGKPARLPTTGVTSGRSLAPTPLHAAYAPAYPPTLYAPLQ